MRDHERHTDGAPVDEETLLRAVERFALLFSEAGMQRMAARVFAFSLIDDADRYTAAEFAEALRVSPAAISQAVRELVAAGLLDKDRNPGSRSDHYRLYDDDPWQAITRQREPYLRRAEESVAEIMELLPEGSIGRRRLLETKEYIAFMAAEVAELAQRWQEHRAKVLAEYELSRGPDPRD